MKKTVAYILTLVLLLSAVLPVSAAAIEPARSKAGMKKETILLQPMEKLAEVPAAEEIAAETLPAETAEYTAPQLNAENAAKNGGAVSGTIKEGMTWSLTEDGVLTISGKGELPAIMDYMDYENYSRVKEVIVKKGITALGDNAFLPTDVEQVTLPAGLKSIGENAFLGCQNLTNVNIPDSVTTLGYRCFDGCEKLAEITIPKGVKEIPDNAFFGTAITEIVIPEGVTSLGRYAFSECDGLEKVVLPDSLIKLGQFCFWRCDKLAQIDLPSGIKEIEGTAFAEIPIQEIVIPSSIKKLEGGMFAGCTELSKVTLPDTITELGDNCFDGCTSLTQIVLPAGLKVIHNQVFARSGLTEIELPGRIESIGMAVFEECSQLTSISIPKSVKEIGSGCFSGCTKLTKITFPEGIKEIGMSTFENSGITEFKVPASVTQIGAFAFRGCGSLKKITWHDSVVSIGNSAFETSALVEMEIPGGIKTLNNMPLANCTDLEKIVIPPSVSQMQDCGLDTCDKVTIYCWENTAAHLYALEWEIPYVLMEEPPQGDVYDLSLISSDLGTVKISTLRTTAGSPVQVDAFPNSDTMMGFVEVYYFSDEEIDLQLEQLSNTEVTFQMPPCEVLVKVLFLDLNNPFWDVTVDDYFLVPVLWARSMGITSGTSENTFSPNDPCTRGQVVTFLWRSAGEPKPESDENPFWDVHPGDYYYDAVLWAVENGITNGVRPGEFAPNDSCTRGQIVTFLWRAMDSPEPIEYDHTFADLDASQYYYNPVLWAVEYGVTNGTSDTTFSPMDICTRGQIVTFLFRTLA